MKSNSIPWAPLTFGTMKLVIPDCRLKLVLFRRPPGWTDEAVERHDDSSSFLGTELSILTLLPERTVRKIL
jgi:hypothetical protein